MADADHTWTSALSVSMSDEEKRRAADGRELWPQIELMLSDSETNWSLTLRFDEPTSVFIEFVGGAVLDAVDGARSVAVPVHWQISDGVSTNCGEGTSMFHPTDGEIVSLDVIALTDDVAPEGGRGRVDAGAELASKLPIDPIPVSAVDLLGSLEQFGAETLALYRRKETAGSDAAKKVSARTADVELARTRLTETSKQCFDTSLDVYEELFLETSTTAEPVHGPIRDEWLYDHALAHDVIERLIDERVRLADAATARSWYKALTMDRNEVANRCLNVLAEVPDQRAIGALLLFVWDDDREFAPRAVSLLVQILADTGSLDETRESRDYVRTQIEELVTRSDHSAVRIAAIEAVSEIGDPTAQRVFERALDDPDKRVRTAARDALGDREH